MSKIKFKGERTASTIKIVIGLVVFLATIFTNFTIGATLITAAISAVAVFELIRAIGGHSKLLYGVSCLVSALITCYLGYVTSGGDKLPPLTLPKTAVLISFYAIIMLTLSVVNNEKIQYVHSVAAFFASVAIPYALSCFIMLNNISYFVPTMSHFDGIYLVCMSFAASWLTDAFAFLVGRKIGKHKMSPKISPKKSVEGAVGGVVLTMLFVLGVSFAFDLVSKKLGNEYFLYDSNIKYVFIAIFSVILSVISMFGDLAASVLKRNVGIKDYSNLLPGHGGIMDRFDSCFFVVPTLFGMLLLVLT